MSRIKQTATEKLTRLEFHWFAEMLWAHAVNIEITQNELSKPSSQRFVFHVLKSLDYCYSIKPKLHLTNKTWFGTCLQFFHWPPTRKRVEFLHSSTENYETEVHHGLLWCRFECWVNLWICAFYFGIEHGTLELFSLKKKMRL